MEADQIFGSWPPLLRSWSSCCVAWRRTRIRHRGLLYSNLGQSRLGRV